MSKLSDLSIVDRLDIEKFLKLGYKIGGIASILSRSHSCIKQEIAKNGNKKDYSAKRAQEAADTRKEHKKGCLYKKFTLEQLEIIRKGIEDGESQTKISEQVGCSHSTIRSYFKRNSVNYKPKHMLGMESRISVLEMQIEILTNQIRILNDRKNQ